MDSDIKDNEINDDEAELICVKIGNKLRVRVIHSNYSNQANCQFPRDLRVEGRRFKCKLNCIVPTQMKNTWFYRINKKGIVILNGKSTKDPKNICLEKDIKNIKIFEDKDENVCGICFERPKAIVNINCGHFFFCEECSDQLTKNICPICRSDIKQKIHIKFFMDK